MNYLTKVENIGIVITYYYLGNACPALVKHLSHLLNNLPPSRTYAYNYYVGCSLCRGKNVSNW